MRICRREPGATRRYPTGSIPAKNTISPDPLPAKPNKLAHMAMQTKTENDIDPTQSSLYIRVGPGSHITRISSPRRRPTEGFPSSCAVHNLIGWFANDDVAVTKSPLYRGKLGIGDCAVSVRAPIHLAAPGHNAAAGPERMARYEITERTQRPANQTRTRIPKLFFSHPQKKTKRTQRNSTDAIAPQNSTKRTHQRPQRPNPRRTRSPQDCRRNKTTKRTHRRPRTSRTGCRNTPDSPRLPSLENRAPQTLSRTETTKRTQTVANRLQPLPRGAEHPPTL